jgi:hypothetical protein
MSEENVEFVRRAFEEFTRGGWEPLMGTYWAPEIVWDMSPARIPGLGTYHGYDRAQVVLRGLVQHVPVRGMGTGAGRGDRLR